MSTAVLLGGAQNTADHCVRRQKKCVFGDGEGLDRLQMSECGLPSFPYSPKQAILDELGYRKGSTVSSCKTTARPETPKFHRKTQNLAVKSIDRATAGLLALLLTPRLASSSSSSSSCWQTAASRLASFHLRCHTLSVLPTPAPAAGSQRRTASQPPPDHHQCTQQSSVHCLSTEAAPAVHSSTLCAHHHPVCIIISSSCRAAGSQAGRMKQ